jgi:hypothetical protein
MFRRLAFSAVVATLVGVTGAKADFITTSATFNSVPVVNNVNQVVGTNAGGFLFNNTINGQGGNPGQSRNIISVGADILNGGFGQVGGGFQAGTFNGRPIVAVTAVTGNTLAQAGGQTLSTITGGSVGLFALPAGVSFNQFNPLTWGATNNLGNAALTPLAVYQIVPPQNIILGPNADPASGPVAAGNVNQISLNTTNATLAQGIFLLRETSDGVPGAGFMSVNNPPLPPNTFITAEGLEAFVNERLAFAQSVDPANSNNPFRFIDPAGSNAAAGLNAMNTIANLLAGTNFASAFGVGDGSGSSFNPYGGPSNNTFPGSGDFGTTFGSTYYPGVYTDVRVNNIPEPASMITFGVFTAGFGLTGFVRRRWAKKA